MTAWPGIGALLRMSAGLILWFSCFVMLYAGYSLGCQHFEGAASDGRVNPVTLSLLIAGFGHALVIALLLARHRLRPVRAQSDEGERSRQFRHRVEGLVLWVSLTGVLFILFPVLMVPPCAG
ncbi:hypothetical protein IC757_11655 [Wenzhouxiangella sp. AB-CW3]|uniref:hypothetical protein n=1 Tax=Wenzhouxiangella sp. AB-CW3 TaxID=2771012 RepID=UPI00168B1FE6|nr:hypothetical protein [Wenzhouxiangella sp. AB-CW3]QOC21693.1 hypothetical protein IC757_11655 [Wenzhouxiangella sp. AB-CW3]